MGLGNIRHVVVVMFENRSFDNLLGWLYDDNNPPQHFIPAEGAHPFDGLKANTYSNTMSAGANPIGVTTPTTNWGTVPATQIPTPDPHEEFEFVTEQVFGTKTPAPGQTTSIRATSGRHCSPSAFRSAR